MTRDFAIHLLDVGDEKYSDAMLLELDGRRVLIDGAHLGDQDGPDGIAAQIQELLEEDEPRIDLLVVTHAHNDHVGCLPALIKDNTITVDWALVADPEAGWGRRPGDDPVIDPDSAVSRVAAALREETRSPLLPDDRLAAFIEDAVTLERRYAEMLDDLATAGTTIVRHGRDNPDPLLAEFAAIGLRILGPTRTQLAATSKGIGEALGVINDAAATMLADAADDPLTAYRRLVRMEPTVIADAAKDRPGDLVNLQSVVLVFRHHNRGLLFTGDMELANESVRSDLIDAELAKLRSAIRANRKYSFVKLPHHGSPNGFDAGVMADIGKTPKLFGIVTGRKSEDHPAASVLSLLASRPNARWMRTDRNGRTSIAFADGTWTVQPSRNAINDPAPPEADVALPTGRAPGAATGTGTAARGGTAIVTTSQDSGDEIRVSLRLPAVHPRIKLTLEIESGTGLGSQVSEAGSRLVPGDDGRPRLLWVTNESGLATNLGAVEAAEVMAWLDAAGGRVLRLPGDVDAGRATALVGEAVGAGNGEIDGVVLIGGYDILPAHRVDVVPASLRTRVDRSVDADQFWVWSDDPYGRHQGLPPIPVSRVPDARSPALVRSALRASGPVAADARGVRNRHREFATQIFGLLSATSSMLISEPIDAPTIGEQLRGDLVYLMLHGAELDGSRFFGEREDGAFLEAMNVTTIDPRPGRIVLTGACWGALTVDPPASGITPGRIPAPRTPENSIALAYLAGGARAVIGATGSHYSPRGLTSDCAGKPMHRAFWQAVLAGQAPAQALLTAKTEFVAGMPHGLSTPAEVAIEHKILQEFSCLGVGW